MAVHDDDLPPGYKFRPDTEQLLVHYLRPKLDGEDFPQGLVHFCDLYGKKEPWQIWNDFIQELSAKDKERTDLYFFTRHKTKTPKGKRMSRTVGTGTWKGEDAPKKVRDTSQRVLGKRRRFRYESDSKESAHYGRWLMHEFELDASLLRNKRTAKDYVLCILRKKSRSVKNNSEDQEDEEDDDMSCDGGNDQQDEDLPGPESVAENTSTQKSDELVQKAAVESEACLEKQIAGQAMTMVGHQDSQKSLEFRKIAMEIEVNIMKQQADQAMKNNDHKDPPKMSLEDLASLLMSDDEY